MLCSVCVRSSTSLLPVLEEEEDTQESVVQVPTVEVDLSGRRKYRSYGLLPTVCVWEGEGVRLHVCNTSFTGSTGTVSLAGDKGSQTMDGLNVAPTDPSQGPRDATTPDPSGAKMDSLVLRSKFKKELVWLPVSNGTLIHSAL